MGVDWILACLLGFESISALRDLIWAVSASTMTSRATQQTAQDDLFSAARGRNADLVRSAASVVGVSAIDAPTAEGYPALHLACSDHGGGSAQVVAALVQAGAGVDAVDEAEGYTPLIQAVEADYNGLSEIIAFLVTEGGASLDAAAVSGRTALSHAAGLGQDETVELLLQHGADPHTPDRSGLTPLHHALLGGQLGVLQRMVELGVELDLEATDSRGRNAFHQAVRSKGNASSLIEWLVTLPGAQAAQRRQNNKEETPYMAAAKGFAGELQQHAKLAKGSAGVLPLSRQVTVWPSRPAELLLGAGADASIPDAKGALADALASSALESVRRELEGDGSSVATAATSTDYEDIMTELFPLGPNVPPTPAPGTIVPGDAYPSLRASSAEQNVSTAGHGQDETSGRQAPLAANLLGKMLDSQATTVLFSVVVAALWFAVKPPPDTP